jgi:Family of unknown function (DUF6510)
MDPVDGNAIGGLLIDVFGTEMTAASTTCATCGTSRPVAELVVYQRAPGTVARCRTCGSVLMVLVRRTHAIGVDLSGLANLSQEAAKGITVSDEQSMSMPEQPQEEPMGMGQPEHDPMSMGKPDQDPMSMGQPDEDPT